MNPCPRPSCPRVRRNEAEVVNREPRRELEGRSRRIQESVWRRQIRGQGQSKVSELISHELLPHSHALPLPLPEAAQPVACAAANREKKSCGSGTWVDLRRAAGGRRGGQRDELQTAWLWVLGTGQGCTVQRVRGETRERGGRRAQFRASCRRSAAFRPNRNRTHSLAFHQPLDTRHSLARTSHSLAYAVGTPKLEYYFATTLRLTPPPPPRFRTRFHPQCPCHPRLRRLRWEV